MLSMNNVIYQITICSGEWDSYTEDTVYADVDLEVVREKRDELKRRGTAALVQARANDDYHYGSDVYGRVAIAIEDGCMVRIERLPLGGDPAFQLAEVIERDEWYMEMFENMSEEPWEGDDPELTRFEQLAAPFEEKYV